MYLCTPGITLIVSYVRVDGKGADFIGNKQTNSLTNIQTLNFSTDSNTVSQTTYQFLITRYSLNIMQPVAVSLAIRLN